MIYWTIISRQNQWMDVSVILVNQIKENMSSIVWKDYLGKSHEKERTDQLNVFV